MWKFDNSNLSDTYRKQMLHDNINDQIEGKTDFLLFHPKYVGNPNFCRNQLNLHLQSQMLNEVRENCFYVLWSCGKTNDPQFITTKKRQNGLGDPFLFFEYFLTERGRLEAKPHSWAKRQKPVKSETQIIREIDRAYLCL